MEKIILCSYRLFHFFTKALVAVIFLPFGFLYWFFEMIIKKLAGRRKKK